MAEMCFASMCLLAHEIRDKAWSCLKLGNTTDRASQTESGEWLTCLTHVLMFVSLANYMKTFPETLRVDPTNSCDKDLLERQGQCNKTDYTRFTASPVNTQMSKHFKAEELSRFFNILVLRLLHLSLTWNFGLYPIKKPTVCFQITIISRVYLLFQSVLFFILTDCLVKVLVSGLQMNNQKNYLHESPDKKVPSHVNNVGNQSKMAIAITTYMEQRADYIRRELKKIQFLSSAEIDCSQVTKLSKDKGECSENKPLSNSNASFEDILKDPGFRVKPQTLIVGIVNGPITVINGIPWSWLNEERWRLHTFAKYPVNTAKSAILLAAEGFAYNGTGVDSDDSVICFFCTGSKQGWREDECIKETHRRLNPDCPMVTGANCNNIPMSSPPNVSLDSRGNQVRGAEALHQDNREMIETDAGPITSPEIGPSGQGAQAQPPYRHSDSTHPQNPNQMASSSVKSSTAPRQTSLRARQNQAPASTVSSIQPSNESGPSSMVTSNNSGSANSVVGGSVPAVAHTSSGNNNVPQPAALNNLSSNSNISSQPANQPSNPVPASQPAPAAQTTLPPNTGSTQSAPVNQSTPPNAPGNQANPPANPQNPTYYQLGIITERPKRYEYAVRLKRYDTFADWPAGHHLRKEDLADAGFYYAGYGDCARCFYCGGGLRNWEIDDDVWVEHARWFPKCAFIRQRVGQVFIDTVAHFAQDHEKITFKMVVEKMNIDPSTFQIDSKETPLKNDPAVVTVKEMGYDVKDIIQAATLLKENSQILSADELFESLETKGVVRRAVENPIYASIEAATDHQREQEMLDTIKKSNNDLRLQYLCKICMDKEVAVVFLPCGHMVCCTECSSAMRDCPVCRKQVKGVVRGFMG